MARGAILPVVDIPEDERAACEDNAREDHQDVEDYVGEAEARHRGVPAGLL